MGVYSIGAHQFLTLDGVPPVRQQEPALVVRPGVDGVSAVYTGKRGRPFALRSRVDCSTKAAALAKRVEYSQLVGAGKQKLIWGDHHVETDDPDGPQVLVLRVETLACGELLTSSGGLNPPSGAYLDCAWDLVLV